MNITLYHGYPDRIGKRFAFAGSGVGPRSYSQTTKDVVQPFAFQNYIDIIHGSLSVSGTYFVRATPSAAGPRQSWKLTWVVVATGAEVANSVDLSAETVVLGGLGGTY